MTERKKPGIKLVILDRDGVINQDSDDFIKSVDEWVPLPGSIEAIVRLKQAGWTVAIATNQSGIARGLYDEASMHAMHDKLAQLLAEHGVAVDYIAFCPHEPGSDCRCRKPLPGMYEEIAAHFNCALNGVPVIGDSLRDLEAAIAVHACPILVRTGKGERTLAKGNLPFDAPVFDDLAGAVEGLLGKR